MLLKLETEILSVISINFLLQTVNYYGFDILPYLSKCQQLFKRHLNLNFMVFLSAFFHCLSTILFQKGCDLSPHCALWAVLWQEFSLVIAL